MKTRIIYLFNAASQETSRETALRHGFVVIKQSNFE